VLQPGKDAWPIEFDYGTVMDGEAEEHIAEVARVLSRYVDLIGVRAFPKFRTGRWTARTRCCAASPATPPCR
jgi:N-acetylornithine carbamoyltransferase